MWNRREFLRSTIGSSAILSLGTVAPSFWLEASQAAEDAKRDTVLVVVQLTGGNDGLNTVVPYAEELYYRNRPQLAIARDDVLKIDSERRIPPGSSRIRGPP